MPSLADLVEPPELRRLAAAGELAAGTALADAAVVTLGAFGPLRVTGTVLDGWDERAVDLRTDGHALAWACDCRDGTVGLFCRHAVAVAVVGWRRAPARAHGRPASGRHPSPRHGTAAAADAQAR